ncbi:MAG: methylglutaconyl-CoA hydratase [Acidimicrobiaceae bacterium]|nr:methylglutaconyl-CoA hydratase [Acidimicrobiaceae bacterium]
MILVEGTPVCTITLSAPDGNVLDLDDLTTLEEAVTVAVADEAVSAIVITGSGDAFSTGARVEDLDDADAIDCMADRLTAIVTTLVNAPKPVVARVNGDAMGGGVALVGAADLAIASPAARVALPEARYGIVATVAIDAIADKISQVTLLDLVLTGRALPAAEARTAGLFSEVAADGALDDVVASRLRQLAKGGRDALARSKQRVRRPG